MGGERGQSLPPPPPQSFEKHFSKRINRERSDEIPTLLPTLTNVVSRAKNVLTQELYTEFSVDS